MQRPNDGTATQRAGNRNTYRALFSRSLCRVERLDDVSWVAQEEHPIPGQRPLPTPQLVDLHLPDPSELEILDTIGVDLL